MLQASIISIRIIEYAGFASKPSDELFSCVCFATYSYLSGCHLHNSLTSRTSMSSLRHLFGLSFLPATLNFIPQQLNSRQNGKFHGHHVESLLGLLMLFSVHSTIIITNTLINQARSYYVITNFYLIWDRRQLYPITCCPPRSHVITTISSM